MTEAHLDLDLGQADIDHETSDDWYTPPYIFEALGLDYELDVSAPPIGVPWIPARRFLSVIDDGLATEWKGRVWMNPPYSNPLPWIDKFIAHGDGVACIPTSTGLWMLKFWESDAAWLMLPPIKFVRSNLVPAKGFMPIRCWLVAIGAENIAALKNSKLGAVR
jgi:hypothetical protein